MSAVNAGKISITLVLITTLVFGVWFYAGWPKVWNNPSIPPEVREAQAVIECMSPFTSISEDGVTKCIAIINTPTSTLTTFTSPYNWNNASNSIEVIGGGGSGGASNNTTNGRATGGGAGAYAYIANYVFSNSGVSTTSYQIGTAGTSTVVGTGAGQAAGKAGGDTWFGTSTCPAGGGSDNTAACAKGGGGGQIGTSGTISGGAAGASSTSWGQVRKAGGRGGNASANISATGGGGAAGNNSSNGNGANGIDATTSAATTGGQANQTTGAAGGTGVSSTCSNGAQSGNAGNSGTEWTNAGSGAGGGAGCSGNNSATAGIAGSFGGGGGGATNGTGGGASRTATSGAGLRGLLVIKYTPLDPTLAQNAFGFYEDGTESGSSAIDIQDTNIIRAVDSDSNLQVRLRIQETAGGTGTTTDDFQLQYSKNSGAYTDVTISSSNVKGFNSGSLTEGEITTNRLTGGSGSFFSGKVSEDGLMDDHLFTANNFTEYMYSLTLISADLANNNTLDFRILRNGATTTYSITPRITVQKTAAATISCSTDITSTDFGTFVINTVTTSSDNASTTMSCSNTTNGCTLYVRDAGGEGTPGLSSASSSMTVVQSNQSDGSDTITLNDVTAGNLIVLAVKWEDNSSNVPSVNDGTNSLTDGGTTWGVSNETSIRWFYLLSSVASGNLTYTVSWSGGTPSFRKLRIAEISYSGTAYYDDQNGAEGSSEYVNSGDITTTGTDEIVFGAYGEYSFAQLSSPQINSQTADGSIPTAPWDSTTGIWWKSFTSTFTGAATAILDTAVIHTASIIAFKTGAIAYTIPSPWATTSDATALLQSGVEGYGVQATTTSAGLTIAPRYLQTGNTIGALELTNERIASSTADISSAEVIVTHKAIVTDSTIEGKYTDTITYECTIN